MEKRVGPVSGIEISEAMIKSLAQGVGTRGMTIGNVRVALPDWRSPSRLDLEFPQGLHVDFNAQARLARERDLAVHDLQFVRDKLFAQQ